MSATAHGGRSIARRPRVPATLVSLAGLLTLLFVGASQGGWAMVIEPYEPLGMPITFLERTPIETYFWPGVFLLAIAAASLLTTVGILLGWRWKWASSIEEAVGYQWPWIGAVATGTILLIFEIIELFLIPFHPLMHPLLLAGSLAIIGLAGTGSARMALRAGRLRY